MRAPTPTPVPIPIPGLTPLPVQQFMAPPAPLPYLGVPPVGFPSMTAPYLGMSPQFMAPPAPVPYFGVPPLGFAPVPIPYLGVPPVGFPSMTAPYLGMSPLGIQQAPYLGMSPTGIQQAQALGLDLQMTSGIGGHHVVSPVTSMLVTQLGLREAVSRVGDEALKQRVTDTINEAIDRTIEGVSGMALHPWYGPGAQLLIYPIASQLALIADRYPEGTLRDALLTIAGQIVQKGLAPTGENVGRRK
jgi:hypothetical protein